MTRKDYINIAAAILATQTRIKGEGERTMQERRAQYGNAFSPMQTAAVEENVRAQLRGVRRTAAHLAEFLADDNPRFNKAQFLTNCGYGAD